MLPSIRLAAVVAASLALPTMLPVLAHAKVKITVDLDAQMIHVESKSKTFDWKVSSGKPGFETPAGTFKVLWMDKDHHSDEYEQAPMPNSIFFAPGYAIHGFGKSKWGQAVSHGCVRLPVAKSAILFDLVKAEGAEINVTGYSPVEAPTVASVNAKRQRQQDAEDARSRDGTPIYDDGDGAPEMRPVRGKLRAHGVGLLSFDSLDACRFRADSRRIGCVASDAARRRVLYPARAHRADEFAG